MPPNPPRATIVATILAAGKGTRMRSRLVKVLHPFLGRPMVLHLVDAAFRAGVDRVVPVVGHQASEVESAVANAFRGWSLGFAHQTEQRGTGHAVLSALPELGDAGTVLVVYGDTPLLRSQTLAQLLTVHRKEGHAMTVATFRAADPTGYGRIVRDPSGDRVLRIVEHADATPDELAITEVNAGICAIRRDLLEPALARLEPHNKQGELYLTDVVELLAKAGEHVSAFTIADPIEASGINTRAQLAMLEEIALQRMRLTWMDRGVSMQDPGSIRIDAEVDIGEDTLLGPNVQLLGKTRIGHGCKIDAGALLDNCELGDFVHIKAYSVATGSRLATGVEVGPFAHLRPGTELGEKAKVGNFVETKMAKFAAHSKASHLSYLGDCEIGRDVNIGAGTITCNYDGIDKHKTIIEDEVFVGSDTQLVAPVRVGRRATIGAGTTVTRDVPEGALVVTRSEARTIPGYYDRHRLPRLAEKRAQRAAAKAERAAAHAAQDPDANAEKEQF